MRFDSGLPRAVTFSEPEEKTNEETAVLRLFRDEFGGLRETQWSLKQKVEDSSHVHLTYDLLSHGQPVFFQQLKLHFNKKGYIDYLTSTLKHDIPVERLNIDIQWETQQDNVKQKLFPKGDFHGSLRGKLGLWLSEDQKTAQWAFDVNAVQDRPHLVRRAIVDAETLEVLQEKRILINYSEPTDSRVETTVNVFPRYPTAPGGSVTAGMSAATITTVDASRLYGPSIASPTFHVRRDIIQRPSGGNYTEVPPANYTPTGDTEPAYAYNCAGNNCPNQQFDAVNVYFHLSQYRAWLQNKWEAFGASMTFPFDPLAVIVNFMGFSIQSYSDGTAVPATTQSNNAAYVGSPCAEDGTMERCLVFLRPRPYDCEKGGGSEEFYPLGREALVVAHEYQHYVTDMITGINFGGSNQIKVGDVIHEGYSDYLGASYVSESSTTDTAVVGAYAFSECPTNYQRNLAIKKVYDDSISYSSPHRPGWVWASALWELRGEWGSSVVDPLAVKSLFYLSVEPGFLESIEALIQADKSLFGGVHENRIRQLFYDERKFLGSLTGVFQDEDKKIVKLGFQGCATVTHPTHSSGAASLALLLVWLVSTVWLGRRGRSC